MSLTRAGGELCGSDEGGVRRWRYGVKLCFALGGTPEHRDHPDLHKIFLASYINCQDFEVHYHQTPLKFSEDRFECNC